MKRLAALCFAALMLSSCVTDDVQFRRDIAASFERIADAIVEELRGSEPSPTLVPTLTSIGGASLVVLDIGGPPGTGNVGTYTTTTFNDWGYWGHLVSEDTATCTAIDCVPDSEQTLFGVFLNTAADRSVTTTVQGTQSGTSPVSGSAIWTGGVRAYRQILEEVISYRAVHGDSRLEVDFTDHTVDVNFTNFINGQAGMSWAGLTMDNGVFGYGTTSIDGSFYGTDHEGAAGTFSRDGLTGVFGAIRTSETPTAPE